MPVDRALVVDGRLVTISANGLLVSDLATLGQLAWVPFPADNVSAVHPSLGGR